MSNKFIKFWMMCLMITLVASSGWLSVTAVPTRGGTILYVKPASSGDCSSWANACHLQTALPSSIAGDQIWVAAGTYKPTNGSDRSISIVLKSGVEVYGGFPAAGGDWQTRDWEANPTILSGDIGVLDNDTDNSYHVVYASGVDALATLDGFTITRGYGASLEGGGMYMINSSMNLKYLKFFKNYAEVGGGIYSIYSDPSLEFIEFNFNFAVYGGGIFNSEDSSPTLMNVIFLGNEASSQGGGMYNGLNAAPLLQEVIFDNNLATDGGGMNNNHGHPTLIDVYLYANTASVGGGIHNYFSDNTLSRVTFSDNTADWGGGMFNVNSSPNLENVTFFDNSATNYGGGIYNVNYSSPTLLNVTFHENEADEGGGIYNNNESNPLITNAIFWSNTPDQIINYSSSIPIVTYSDIEGGYAGVDNLNDDPQLGLLADNGGFTLTHALQEGSPAIDTGSPTICPLTDQRGVTRPIDGDVDGDKRCDIGAYEYGTEPILFFMPLIRR